MDPLVHASLFVRRLLRRAHGLVLACVLAAYVATGGAAAAFGPLLGAAASALVPALTLLLLLNSGKLPLVGIAPALAEIGRLLGRARALQVPIIHIVHRLEEEGQVSLDAEQAVVA